MDTFPAPENGPSHGQMYRSPKLKRNAQVSQSPRTPRLDPGATRTSVTPFANQRRALPDLQEDQLVNAGRIREDFSSVQIDVDPDCSSAWRPSFLPKDYPDKYDGQGYASTRELSSTAVRSRTKTQPSETEDDNYSQVTRQSPAARHVWLAAGRDRSDSPDPPLIRQASKLMTQLPHHIALTRPKSLRDRLQTFYSSCTPVSRHTLFLACLVIFLIYTSLPPTLVVHEIPSNHSGRPEDILDSLPLPNWSETPADPVHAQARTSFATPQHTLKEILQLPSRFHGLNNSVTHTGPPSVSVFIDCSSTHVGAEQPEQIRLVLRFLQRSSATVQEVRFLISSNNEGAFKTIRETATPIASTTLLSPNSAEDLIREASSRTNTTDFVLLMDCPTATPSLELMQSDGLGQLLQIASTTTYSKYALTDAGVRMYKNLPGSESFKITGHQARVQASPSVQDMAVSQPLDLPFGLLLLPTSLLQALPNTDGLNSGPDPGDDLLLGSASSKLPKIGAWLCASLGLRTFGVPVTLGIHDPAKLEEFALHLKDRERVLRHVNEKAERTASQSPGGSARVALLLADGDKLVQLKHWASIVCGFGAETRYGHQVALLVTSDRAKVEDWHETTCPQASILLLDNFHTWQPNICLSSAELQTVMPSSCIRISIPSEELAHADWLFTLPLESLLNWHKPTFDLVVITNDRPSSLNRLLTSLRSAYYFGDRPSLYINLEQTADAATQKLVSDMEWPFGNLVLRYRIVLGGLMTSIVEGWYPSSNDSYGVLLEDDIEVSPHFYAWLKYTVLYYRYGPQSVKGDGKRMIGVSLYQPKNLELRPEGRRKFDAHALFSSVGIPSTIPYLSQVPCSWGAAYFPEAWREFHQFLTLRLSEKALDLREPIVQDIRSNRWLRSWKRYLIELMYLRGYLMLYPNHQGFRSLSTNHVEQGTHVKDGAAAAKRRAAFEVHLLNSSDNLLEDMPTGVPELGVLPILDFWGTLVTADELQSRGIITRKELGACTDDSDGACSASSLSYDARELLRL